MFLRGLFCTYGTDSVCLYVVICPIIS